MSTLETPSLRLLRNPLHNGTVHQDEVVKIEVDAVFVVEGEEVDVEVGDGQMSFWIVEAVRKCNLTGDEGRFALSVVIRCCKT